jgi:pimeloyl-ACP methyl ester carboxylesterase
MSEDPNPAPAREKPKLWVRILRGLLYLLLALVLAGLLYQAASHQIDKFRYPMPGTLVDMGGYKMHIYCIGSGSPTVILDSGLGDSMLSWARVQSHIAQFTRVCSYDRAGMGWSDPSPNPRTSREVARELYELLQKSEIKPPYILVGHSWGGLNMQVFAKNHLQELSGMVLVDSSHENQFSRFPEEVQRTLPGEYAEIRKAQVLLPFGIPRLMGSCEDNPPELKSETNAVGCQSKVFAEIMAELKSFESDPGDSLTPGLLGNLPLVVLSHDSKQPLAGIPAAAQAQMAQIWIAMQNELAQLSTNSSHIEVKDSGHYIQIDQPSYVIDAIRTLVLRARAPLADNSSSQPSAAPAKPALIPPPQPPSR